LLAQLRGCLSQAALVAMGLMYRIVNRINACLDPPPATITGTEYVIDGGTVPTA
jgi:hypothetical protein